MRVMKLFRIPKLQPLAFGSICFGLSFAPAEALDIVLEQISPQDADGNDSVNFYAAADDGVGDGTSAPGEKLDAIFTAAASYWEDHIHDNVQVTIQYFYTDYYNSTSDGVVTQKSPGWLAQATDPTYNALGNLISGQVRLVFSPANSDGTSTPWYYDATPYDHSEFDIETQLYRDLSPAQKNTWFSTAPPALLEVSFRGDALNPPLPGQPNLTNTRDMLSTVIHEMGHLLGLSSRNPTAQADAGSSADGDGDFDIPGTWTNGDPFTIPIGRWSGGSFVPTPGQSGHIAPQSLMCGSCAGIGRRRLPTSVDIIAVAHTGNWNLLDLPHQDFLPQQIPATSGDWHTGSNWEGGSPPDSDDDAFIRLGTSASPFVVSLSDHADVSTLWLEQYSELDVGSEQFIVGTTTLAPNPTPDQNLKAKLSIGVGTFQTNDLNIDGGILTIGGGTANIYSNLDSNNGTISGYGVLNVDGIFNNQGTLNVEDGDLTLSTIPQTKQSFDLDGTDGSGAVTLLSGDLNILGALTGDYEGILTVSGGHTATFNRPWTLGNAGRIFLVSNTGQSTIAGNTLTAPTGKITTSGNCRFTSAANFGGSLDLEVLGGILSFQGISNTTGGSYDLANNTSLSFTQATQLSGGSFQLNEGSTLTCAGPTVLSGGAFSLEDGALFDLKNTTFLQGSTISGSGELQFDGPVTINTATTINTAFLDFDGVTTGDDTHTLKADLTINSSEIDDHDNSFDDHLTINGSSTLNLVNVPSWSASGTLLIDTNSTTNPVSITGAPFSFSGNATIDDTTTWDTVSTISGSISLPDSSDRLVLSIGNLFNPNILDGGSITGDGTLRATNNATLVGHGTISSRMEFYGSLQPATHNTVLQADNGTLNLTIDPLGQLPKAMGTRDNDGILNITNSWTLPASTFGNRVLSLNGGAVTGGGINNHATIQGHGLLSPASLINNGTISAFNGTLTITASGGIDLDGTSNQDSHVVNATEGSLLFTTPLTDNFDGILNIGPEQSVTFQGGEVLFSSDSLLDFEGESSLSHNPHLEVASATIAGRIQNTGQSLITGHLNFPSESELDIDELFLSGDSTLEEGVRFYAPANSSDRNLHLISSDFDDTPSLDLQDGFSMRNENSLIIHEGILTIAGIADGAVSVHKVATGNPFKNWTLAMDIRGTAASRRNDLLDLSTNFDASRVDLDITFASGLPSYTGTWKLISSPQTTFDRFASVVIRHLPARHTARTVVQPDGIYLVITKITKFSDWAEEKGLPADADGHFQDADGDDLPNALELLLGSDPNSPDPDLLSSPVITEIDGQFYHTLQVPVSLIDIPDYDLLIESSTDLESWTQTDVVMESATDAPGGDTEIRLYRSKFPISSKPREYFRVGTTLERPLIWMSESLPEPKDTDSGRYASLAISPLTKRPAIAFMAADTLNGGTQSLHLAELDGTKWQISQLDADSNTSGNGAYCSLAFSPVTGQPAISYLEGSPNNNLRFISRNSKDWNIETVDNRPNVGRFTSLAFTPDGQPAIAYQNFASKDVLYAQYSGSKWILEDVASDGQLGRGISLAFESKEGSPRISYENGNSAKLTTSLEFAFLLDKNWGTETADGSSGDLVGRDSSLVYQPLTRQATIAYAGDGLHYAVFNGSSWDLETIAPNALYSSLAYHPDTNQPWISFYNNDSAQLNVAIFNGNKWIIEKLDTEGDVGQFTSLAFDSQGIPHIAYYDVTNTNLKYATKIPDPAF